MKRSFQLFLMLNALLMSQTESEIKRAKGLMQKAGLSESQARNLAKTQGYSDKQIDAAIQKEKMMNQPAGLKDEVINNQNNILDMDISNEQNNQEIQNVQDDSNLEEEELIVDLESVEQAPRNSVSYFGYDIFSKDPALFQETSVGSVDPNYMIGTGDEIIVMLWGETQFRQVLTVGREGFVFIPEVGQVFVNGLNLNLLEAKLFRVFSQSYASLNPQNRNPSTFLDVSLGRLRPLRIQVLGQVSQPGAYTVSPSATLFSSLYYFNGPTTRGSLRDIQLIRDGAKIASIDFYDYLLTGKKPKDIKLQLDDVIFITRRLKTITIEGEINRSGIYELKPNETLRDLVFIAGNLNTTAYLDLAQIDRIVPFENRDSLGMDRMIVDVNLKDILKPDNTFPIYDGDRVKVFSISSFPENIVYIKGAVNRPGKYDLSDSIKIADLISVAGGLLGDAYLKKADLVRIKPDFTEEIIEIDLMKALELDAKYNIILKGNDRIRIYSTIEMIEQKYVFIRGHSKKTGKFLLHENMTVHDLIFMSGGFIDEQFKKETYLQRADLLRLNDDGITRKIINFNLKEILESPKSKINFLLENRDIIIIHKNTVFNSSHPISIYGTIPKPGVYNFKTNMTLKDLIIESGGLNDNIFRCRVEVARIDPFNDDLSEFADVIDLTLDKNFNLNYNGSDKNKLFNSSGRFILKEYDYVTLRPDPYFNKTKLVTVDGEVLYPGSYVILNSNEKISDIINRAGGILPSAYLEASKYVRNNISINISLGDLLKNPSSKNNFKVQAGDKITIEKSPNIVMVLGQVNNDGAIKFTPGHRLKDYLSLSGGLSSKADRKNIWIKYPDGTSKKNRRWSIISPLVMDGSVINVGTEKEKEAFDRTEFAKEVTSILASLAQVIAIIFLSNQN
jgi:polysaccharide biosynthesis/export protein